MESGHLAAVQLINSPVEPFTEDETSKILEAVLRTMDTPFKRSQDVPKTILIDFFGTQKSMKTAATGKVEQLFRRHKFKAFCPPETAEIESVRSEIVLDPVVFQATHLNGVYDQVLSLANHPRFHLAITSRGLIDMLYWYEKGLRKGLYSPVHVQSVKEFVYEFLRKDLVDSFFFFTCSVQTAMRREYDGSLTNKTGSKMNERDIAATIEIYESVIAGVNRNVPGLPIYHVDTSEMDLRQAGQEVVRFLLPTICNRFQVPAWRFMPYSLSLIKKQASASPYFEEQLKFAGHPSRERIESCGWEFVRESSQEDIYLSPGEDHGIFDPFGPAFRIRKEGDVLKFMYKGDQKDRMLSHRRPLTLALDSSEADKILAAYHQIASLKKHRSNFKKDGATFGDDHFFTLHVDSIEGLGNYTEIRARGSSDRTHTAELLRLAQDLGLSLGAMVEGSYLSLALNLSKTP